MKLVRLLTVFVVAAAAMGANAQQAELRIEQGPHYAGVPVVVQIVAHGFEESPQPVVTVDTPSNGRLDALGVSPSVSTSIQIINGVMSESKTVRFVYRYRFTADTPGRFEVGPFRVTQNASLVETQRVSFDVVAPATSADQHIKLVLPDTPLWVGQRVPIALEWWVSEKLAGNVAGHRVRVPLFEQVDHFKFEDETDPQARNRLVVESATGREEFPATVRRAEWQGEPYLVLTVRRTIVPLKALEIDLPATVIVTEEAIRWRQDIFGQRVPNQVRQIRAEDKERTLLVRSPPAEDRPESYSGAVGRGFTIDSSTDRSVVQIGDPIQLTLTVRGDAALETVSLPPLLASGLGGGAFRIAAAAVGGIIDTDAKRFEVTLRVIDQAVREIPPIALSWFDPERGVYETTYSRPIALSVRGAEIVSADDVQRTSDAESATNADVIAAPTASDDVATTVRSSSYVLRGADLSIETNLAELLSPIERWYTRTSIQVLAYAIGLAALVVAVLARRRALLDPATFARLKELQLARKHLERVSTIDELAAVLRRMAATASTFPRSDYERLINECDTHTYAPGGGSTDIESSLRVRARSLADAMVGAST